MSEDPSKEIALQTAGARLREARDQKGLSLEEAARVTRIAKGYLKALEDDCHDRLPNEAYARGFLRVYARYLDLPPEEVMGSLMLTTHDGMEPDGGTAPETDGENPESATPRPAKRWLLICLPLFLLGAALLAASILKQDKKVAGTDVSPRNRLTSGTTSVAPPPAQPGSLDEKDIPRQTDTKEGGQFETSETPARGIILRLKAIEDGALDITIDNMISQHYDLKAGDIIEWKGEKVFSLDLQNAGGVEAELNGKMLAPFGEKGMQAHIRLSPVGGD